MLQVHAPMTTLLYDDFLSREQLFVQFTSANYSQGKKLIET